MSEYSRIKGVADIFEPESIKYTQMEAAARHIFGLYAFEELRTPLLEFTNLFRRSIGTETDVVQKEMFTFTDSRGREMSLRPEATAGVMRAAIDGGLAREGIVSRFYTMGPMFRHERPQKGRMRQFHQINCECLGTQSPLADASMILMLLAFLENIGVPGLSLRLNTLGCRECRPAYIEKLRAWLAGRDEALLCENCRQRKNTNPLRVLDCKDDGCRKLLTGAPKLADNICPACREHFSTVLNLLEKSGVCYSLDDNLVRGLDYYCRTTFEVVSESIGAQTAVAGGGRYDGLVAQLGGADIPGVGFACGMERLALLMREPSRPGHVFYIAPLCPEALEPAFMLAESLHRAGLSGEAAFSAASLKSQLRKASARGARFALLLGPDELSANQVAVKDMRDGAQCVLPPGEAAEWLAARV